MDVFQLLVSLYAINGFIAVIGYWPQITSLYKSTTAPVSFSRAGWSLWTYTTLITFLYALLINGDPLFILVSSLYFLGTTTIWSLVIFKRWKYQ